MWRRQTSCGTCPLRCRCDPLEGHRDSWPREMVWNGRYIVLDGWAAAGIAVLEGGSTLSYVGLQGLGSLLFSGASAIVSA